MSQIRDYIEIDRKFQNSINLRLDLENEQKINSYIPTKSAISVLSRYLTHIKDDVNKANLLIGPYGKGKSHLLLVLLYLISMKDNTKVETIINKFEKTDVEVANLIREIRNTHKPFLPVLISGTAGSLRQSFLLGLNEALERAGLSKIAPNSYYSEAVKMIETWENDFQITYKMLDDLVKKAGLEEITSAKELKDALKNNGKPNKTAMEFFVEVYPQLTAGAKFNPIVEIETVKLYQDISQILYEQYGYGGIYIIFDEFSKYVEGHEQDNFSEEMKIIQDICELAQSSNRSSEKRGDNDVPKCQIHITMVAHKSLKEYGKNLDKKKTDAYTGVEGRIKEEHFIVSAQNNYELICNVVKKINNKHLELLKETVTEKQNVKAYEHLPGFNGMFTEDEFQKTIVAGCFPLLPLTSYCLLGISEKVAQNERSIFTFLANEENGSLISILNKQNDEENWKVAVDSIYDYFKNLFKENVSLARIHSEWLKAEYALSKSDTLEQKKVIKCLAILRMLNRPEEVPVDSLSLRLASGIPRTDFDEILDELTDKQLIVYREKISTYAFRNNVGLDLDKEINKKVAGKQINDQLNKYIGEFSELGYELPKLYNQDYKMTRYFNYEFLSVNEFLKIDRVDYLYQEINSDGKIICLIIKEDAKTEAVKKHLEELKDSRNIVIIPNYAITEDDGKNITTLKKLIVIRDMLGDSKFLEQNKVLENELKIYQEDLSFELNAKLEKMYLPYKNGCNLYIYNSITDQVEKIDVSSEKEFNRLLSEVCRSYYEKAPKINNELINRKHISAQIKKARTKLVKQILEEEDLSIYDKGTSPEATIYRAVFMKTGVDNPLVETEEGCQELINLISDFIKESAGNKNSFENLYSKLEGKKYGIRRGIVPLFIAKAFVELDGMPIIYLEDKEVTLNEEILTNINEKSKDYYLYIESEDAEKSEYLEKLEEIFVETYPKKAGKKSDRKRLVLIVSEIQKWLHSLPQYTMTFKTELSEVLELTNDTELIKCENIISMQEMKKFRKIFGSMELNARDILFDEIPTKLNCSIAECFTKIEALFKYLEGHLNAVEKETAARIRKTFGAKDNENLSAFLNDWYNSQSEWAKKNLMDDQTAHFMECIKKLKTNSDVEITKKISKAVLDVYIEDWNDNSLEIFISELDKIKSTIENTKEEDSESKSRLSFTGKNGEVIEKYFDKENTEDDSTTHFLWSMIESTLEDFGDSLETNQKVSVLVNALEKVITDSKGV